MIRCQEGRKHQQINEVWNLRRTVFAENRRATYEEISQVNGISPNSVIRIFTKDLQNIKICARWVPHCLTAEQKQKSLVIGTLLKQRFNFESQAFLCRIVAIEEAWKSPTSPRPKKFRRSQSKVKKIIFACGHRRIIMKVVADLLSKYEWEVLLHAPYSPDIIPPDFDLFPKLKEPMRVHHFYSLEEVSAAVTRGIRGLNKSGNQNGIVHLSKRWDAVIEKQGGYIEGL